MASLVLKLYISDLCEGFLKTMIYCGLLFSSLENHHQIEEDLGDVNREP